VLAHNHPEVASHLRAPQNLFVVPVQTVRGVAPVDQRGVAPVDQRDVAPVDLDLVARQNNSSSLRCAMTKTTTENSTAMN